MAKDVQRTWGNNQRLLLHNRNTSISAGSPLKSSLPASDPFMLIPVLLFHLCGVIPATPNSPGTSSFIPVHLESYSWVCFCEMSGLLDGCQDLNSGPHKCVVSTLSSPSYKFLDCLLGPQFSLVASPRSSFHLVEHSTIPIPALYLPVVSQSTVICLCPCHLPHLLHQRPPRRKSPNQVGVHVLSGSAQSFTSWTSLCAFDGLLLFPVISPLISVSAHLTTLLFSCCLFAGVKLGGTP